MTIAKRNPAAFLDRDGVINHDRGYVHRIEDFDFLPGAPEAMRKLSDAGYRLVIVTNQSGIGRGYFNQADFDVLMADVLDRLRRHGVTVAGVYHCPHTPARAGEVGCDCRKPAPGMIRAAVRDLDINAAASIMVGDKASDIAAGRAASVGRCYLVGAEASRAADWGADAGFRDLAACVGSLLQVLWTLGFSAYPIGYFHIEIAEVRIEQRKRYLIVPSYRTSKFAFVEVDL